MTTGWVLSLDRRKKGGNSGHLHGLHAARLYINRYQQQQQTLTLMARKRRIRSIRTALF